jgi:hypothetical protein
MKTQIIILFSLLSSMVPLKATSGDFVKVFSQWPALTIQNEVEVPQREMIDFEETDLKMIDRNVEINNQPMIPLNTKRQFTELVSMANPDIKWRVSMSAFSSSNYSGFSKSIGGTTMLIEDELFLDVEVGDVQLHSKDDRYKHYSGDKYHLDTMLHWYPTENFSLHLGISTWVDK